VRERERDQEGSHRLVKITLAIIVEDILAISCLTPVVGTSVERTFMPDQNSRKMLKGRPLVKMSVNCEVVGTWRTRTTLVATRSRTK
jgi:hypothetical protein